MTARLLVLILLAAAPLGAQTTECAKIEATSQAAICYQNELAKAESDMQASYKKMLAYYAPTEDNLHGLHGTEREDQRRWYVRLQRQIRASQRAFLAYRANTCAIHDIGFEGTAHAIVAPACRWELTRQRAEWFRQRLKDVDADD